MINKLSVQLSRWSHRFYQRRVLGIDIGDDSIKLAEGVCKNHKILLSQVHVEQLADDRTDSLAVEQLAECLVHAVQVAGIQARQVIAAVPYDKVFYRELVMPIMNYQELREAVHWELAKIQPFSDGYYSDFAIIDEQENGKKILLVAAERTAVDFLSNTFARASLDLIAVESLPLALGRVIDDNAAYMLVDIGRQVTVVTIYQAGIPVSSNFIRLGGQNFTTVIQTVLNISQSAAEQLKRRSENDWYAELNKVDQAALTEALLNLQKQLSREIMRIYEYYKIQNRDNTINKIFLCGGAALLSNLSAIIQNEIRLPVQLFNNRLPVECIASLDETTVLSNMPQTAAAIGMVMRGN